MRGHNSLCQQLTCKNMKKPENGKGSFFTISNFFQSSDQLLAYIFCLLK